MQYTVKTLNTKKERIMKINTIEKYDVWDIVEVNWIEIEILSKKNNWNDRYPNFKSYKK